MGICMLSEQKLNDKLERTREQVIFAEVQLQCTERKLILHTSDNGLCKPNQTTIWFDVKTHITSFGRRSVFVLKRKSHIIIMSKYGMGWSGLIRYAPPIVPCP